jgi:ABC-2 type transport system ATP-binding protein
LSEQPIQVLQVKNLTKKYGDRKAVDNITFDIYEGEIFGFLGPNGAGKTTTIKLIAGLAKPTSGEITICGQSLKRKFEKAIRNIGGVIENPILYKEYSGIENLKYYASLYPNVTLQRINDVVELVGLTDRINDKVKTYSLGMKQRLGIAQALLHNPKLLILDEPTNGLDPNGVLEMRTFLKRLAHSQGISILISSHILAEMELICDTIGIMNNGKIIDLKTVDQMTHGNEAEQKIEISVNFPNFAGKLLMNKYNLEHIDIVKNKLTVPLSKEKIPAIIQLLVINGVDIYAIGAVSKTLEQVFLETVSMKALPYSTIDEGDK